IVCIFRFFESPTNPPTNPTYLSPHWSSQQNSKQMQDMESRRWELEVRIAQAQQRLGPNSPQPDYIEWQQDVPTIHGKPGPIQSTERDKVCELYKFHKTVRSLVLASGIPKFDPFTTPATVDPGY